MSMMRVTDGLLGELKLLKAVKSTRGKLSTHAQLVQDLIKTELRITHVETNDGWIEVGSTVEGVDGEPTVILRLSDGMVHFSNSTYIINGSSTCLELKVLNRHSGWFN